MKMVRGIQRRQRLRARQKKPQTDFVHRVGCTKFVIERRSSGKDVSVDVFFPRASDPNQGVGISLPSTEVAITVGHALLAVAEGCSDKMEGHFE